MVKRCHSGLTYEADAPGVDMELKHPALVAIIGGPLAAAMIGGLLWIKDTVLQPSDLRAAIEHPIQFVPLLSQARLKLNGSDVFCDTVKFSLLLSHNHNGHTPILINRISVKTAALDANVAGTLPPCHIDSLSSRPFGVEPRDTYTISITRSGATARFIHSEKPGQAWSVSVDNILDSKEKHISVNLEEASSPILYDFFATTHNKEFVRVWFEIYYDANGPKEFTTDSLILIPSSVIVYSK
jgi:hypothetical protein